MQPEKHSEPTTLSCQQLSWRTPEGHRVLDEITFALGMEKTGLVGNNGSGKTTLARLLVGELTPTAGTVRRTGTVGWLPQGVEAKAGATVAQALGIDDALTTLAAIEEGNCEDRLFECLNDRWDIAERAAGILHRLALPDLPLDVFIDRLSGGEAMRVALAGCYLAEPDFLILDEPSNHLDHRARQALYTVLNQHRGGLLVISHDRALLRRMERTIELSPQGLRSYGGGFDDYQEQVRVEQEAARRAVDDAALRLARQQRAAQEAKDRQTRRAASGRRRGERRGLSKIEIQGKKSQAERTNARLHNLHEERLAKARQNLQVVRENVRNETLARLHLGATALPTSKTVVEAKAVNLRWPGGDWLWPTAHHVHLIGPTRLRLEGASGSGKSTLAAMLIGRLRPTEGTVRVGEKRIAWLDQRCRILPPEFPILEGMQQVQPTLDRQQIYWSLHRMGLDRDVAQRRPETLSGGERMRAALACLFALPRPPRLLVLDEPTNNLDIATVGVLERALAEYRGALILISHDADFVHAIGVDQRLELVSSHQLRHGRVR